MPSRILVPLDGSALAQRVVPLAKEVARSTGRTLAMLQVVPRVHARLYGSAELALAAAREDQLALRRAQTELARLAETLGADGVTANVILGRGESGRSIVEQTALDSVDLVVMSTHGEGGLVGVLFGSVAEYVITHSRVPVLLVPPWAQVSWPSGRHPRLLVALDGSRLAEQAVAASIDVARGLSPELLLLTVLESDGPAQVRMQQYQARLAARLRSDRPDVRTFTASGAPAERIAALGAELDADMLAMGTHGRTGLSRLVIGSVAGETLRRAELPILLVSERARVRWRPALQFVAAAWAQQGHDASLRS